ncbi:MAG: serine--tRNA ligase [Candidatus Moraniibacteriota bacterium]|nr:MAG: serine--tRNA ligase [Candidatus Moranbacteria bacterium]
MLDIQYIRDHKDEVSKAAEAKHVSVDIDQLLELDARRKELLREIEELRSIKNDINDLIPKAAPDERAELVLRGKEVKGKLDVKEPELKETEESFRMLMYLVPNIPSEDTPSGPDESGNQVLRHWGEKPSFEFQPKEHWEIAEALGLMDTERATKVSGARFLYLKGDLVLLEWAMMSLAFQTLTNEETLRSIAAEASLDVPTTPFVPVLPPVMIRPDMHRRMGRLDPEEMYALERDNLTLIGSAEHTLGSMYADEILAEKELPIRLVGFSAAFRREAGSYGKDMKGMLRLHQFNKLEMESFTTPEASLAEQNFFVAIQEYLLRQLNLPYQVVAVCSGDMGKPDMRQIDIEAWMPGQGKYRETNTSDLIGDFQARRLETRVRRENGSVEYAHMNDATAFSERPLIAILENYQQADGSVIVPKVLRPFVGKEVIAVKK